MTFADVNAMVGMVRGSSAPVVEVQRDNFMTRYSCGDRVAEVYTATTGAFGLRINEVTGRATWHWYWRWHGGKFCGAHWSEAVADAAARAWCRDGVTPTGR
jgi:hypothetical protein